MAEGHTAPVPRLRGPDPRKGVWRWTWQRLSHHLGGWIVGAAAVPVIGAVVGALFHPLSASASAGSRAEQALLSAFMALGIVVVLVAAYALLVAPYEQRRELRSLVQTLADAVERPGPPSRTTLEQLAYEFREGDRLFMHFESAAGQLPPRRQWDGMSADEKKSHEGLIAALEETKRELTEWAQHCDRVVEALLGGHHAALMGSFVDFIAAMPPGHLDGWGDSDWLWANQRFEWLKAYLAQQP